MNHIIKNNFWLLFLNIVSFITIFFSLIYCVPNVHHFSNFVFHVSVSCTSAFNSLYFFTRDLFASNLLSIFVLPIWVQASFLYNFIQKSFLKFVRFCSFLVWKRSHIFYIFHSNIKLSEFSNVQYESKDFWIIKIGFPEIVSDPNKYT